MLEFWLPIAGSVLAVVLAVVGLIRIIYLETVMTNSSNSGAPRQSKQPSEQQIRDLAYQMWEQAGRPEGDGSHFWAQAEKTLNENK